MHVQTPIEENMYCRLLNENTNEASLARSLDQSVKTFEINNEIVKLASGKNTNQYIIEEKTPISNQGYLSCCVAEAVTACYEILLGVQNKKVEQLSRLFVYWNSRLYTKDTDKDAGTYIACAMQSLVDFGVCSEDTWSFVSGKVFTQPNQIAYKEGDDNRYSSFFSIRSSGQQKLDEMVSAIKINHPIIFSTAIDKTFQEYFSNEDYTWSAPSEDKIIGYHAMVITGFRYNPNLEFYVRNSWGDRWGMNGHCWMSADYMLSKFSQDFYVGTNMDNLLR